MEGKGDWPPPFPDPVTVIFPYRELKVNPTDFGMMLGEPTHNSKECREKTTEIMFEKFKVPALYMAKNAGETKSRTPSSPPSAAADRIHLSCSPVSLCDSQANCVGRRLGPRIDYR